MVDIGDVPAVGEKLAADGHRRDGARPVHVDDSLGISKSKEDIYNHRPNYKYLQHCLIASLNKSLTCSQDDDSETGHRRTS